jgi:hypothetical protein
MSNVPGDGSAEPEPPPAFEPVEFRDSLPVYLVWLVAMVVLTTCAVAFWPTWGPTPLLAFGSAAVAAALRVLRRRVRLRIAEEGIIDHTGWYSPGLIPWEDVVDVRPGPWGYVQLDLTEASSFWERQTPLRQRAPCPGRGHCAAERARGPRHLAPAATPRGEPPPDRRASRGAPARSSR